MANAQGGQIKYLNQFKSSPAFANVRNSTVTFLSRRKQGFESPRERQSQAIFSKFNNFGVQSA